MSHAYPYLSDLTKIYEIPYQQSHIKHKTSPYIYISVTNPILDIFKYLGIPPPATLDELKKAYRKSTLILHPDKSSHLSEPEKDNKLRLFHVLRNEYETLTKK
jgi:DnaJ-class molecular chaperone